MKNDVFTVMGLATFLICVFMLIGSCLTEIANAETLVFENPRIFKLLFENHEYLSTNGKYIIHSESCPCRKEKK